MARGFSVLSEQFKQLSVLTLSNNQIMYSHSQSVFSGCVLLSLDI